MSRPKRITQPTTVIQPSAWSTLYNGYGSVTWDNTGVKFAPKSATSVDETHAVMILKNATSVKDFTIKVKAKTTKQLRINSPPNAWECFWLVFNYLPSPDGFKTANYVVLKPNGIEVGTMNSDVGQKFLFTSNMPKMILGVFNNYEIRKNNKTLEVLIDGVSLFNRTFEGLYDQAGTFGLYSEDAECLVESFT